MLFLAAALGCPHCPQRSDVVLTSRAVHLTPPAHTPLTTWAAATAFGATRIDWVYTSNASWVAAAARRGLEVTLAMNPQAPDGPHASSWRTGRLLNIGGKPLVAPWMRSWPGEPRNYGCVNNPEYIRIAQAMAEGLVAAGAGGIQHDDPGSNFEAAGWNGGDPELSGCYCSYCMDGFTRALLVALSPAERAALNVTASFSYKQFLSTHPWHSADAAVQRLRALFLEYQLNVTERYLQGLRAHIDANIPLSCNNGGKRWAPPLGACSYGLGELSASDAKPDTLEAMFQLLPPPGKMQVVTMPKATNVSLVEKPAFTTLIRTSIAYSYALGGNMMVPWDIYLPTPDAERYYGKPDQFADLYAFVRAHGALLDAADIPVPDPRGSEAQYALVHTGAVGDGMRWRFPYPYTSGGYSGPRISGSRHTGVTVVECQQLCDAAAACAGVYTTAQQLCYTLDALVACDTGLIGASWARNASAGAGLEVVANSSEPEVRAKARLPANRTFATVHVVDWRPAASAYWSTGTPPPAFGPVELNVSNSILSGGSPPAACGRLKFTLHLPGGAPPRALAGACRGAVTQFTLSSPTPWAMLEVRPR